MSRKFKTSIADHPLFEEWNSDKNIHDPYRIATNSKIKVWWRCDKGHEWEARVSSRVLRNGCPFCSNHKVDVGNCLATTYPVLAAQWHPTKNGDLTPYDVTIGTSKKIWWKCDKAEDHEWQVRGVDRKKTGCPMCSGKRVVKSNCLATTQPALAAQWHPTKNGDLTPYDVTAGTPRKLWWKCDKAEDHEWQATGNNRIANNNCPMCSGKRVVKSNCLATTQPALAAQWHPTKNGDLTPYDVTICSNKRIWWVCQNKKDHEWHTSPNNRSAGTGCPRCNLSKGELLVGKILTELNVKHTKQVCFANCKYEKILFFDFLVELESGIRFLIEFQGQQHYESIEYFGGKKKLDVTIRRDEVKKEFCQVNQIPLLIIPYWEKTNIKSMLIDFINNISN